MRKRFWIGVVAILLGVAGCNLQASSPTATPTSTPSLVLDTPTSSSSTLTPVPIETLISVVLPTDAPTSTLSVFLASPKDQPVNCRFGPATSYAITGALLVGKQAEIIGRSADFTWWYVRNPSDPSTSCWLSAEFVITVGDVGSLPVINPLENTVTDIQVRVEPSVINVPCDALPQVVTISAQITTSGPTIVVWRWASSDGTVSADQQVLFEAGGTKTVQDYYQVSAIKDYIVQVQTTLPNIATGETSLRLVCTP